MLLKRNIGWIGMVVLSLTPLIPWYFALLPFHYRFMNPYSTYTTLGDMFGLIGITMFSLVLILSARLEFFEDFFGGMNRVYVAHHIFGAIAFMLLLCHPLFMAAGRMTISIKQAALFLLPSDDWSINFGMAGLLLMMSLLVLTLFVNLPYQVWRFTHKFLGAVFLIAVIHGFFMPSDILRYMPLKLYMLLIVGLGTAAYLYRTILGRFLVRRYTYSVTAVKIVRENVVEIGLLPQKNKMHIVPGQFLFVSFANKAVGTEVHPFSVASVSENGELSLVVKAEGDYTSRLKNLLASDRATIEGGFGRFTYSRYKHKKQIWIAGGIGITPFLSMVGDLIKKDFSADLFYTVRTPDEAVYLEELQQIAQMQTNFRVFPFFTKTQGRLTAEMINQMSGDAINKDIFVCGPPPMMKSMRSQFIKLGVPNRNIHTEEFALYD